MNWKKGQIINRTEADKFVGKEANKMVGYILLGLLMANFCVRRLINVVLQSGKWSWAYSIFALNFWMGFPRRRREIFMAQTLRD